MTILSDGTVTCGLDDADGLRSFDNPEYTRLKERLARGQTCRDCAMYQPRQP